MAILYSRPPLTEREAELRTRMLEQQRQERLKNDKRLSTKPRNPLQKKCTECFELKSASEFYASPTSADRLTSKCKACLAEYQRSRAGVIKLRRSLRWK